MVLSCICAVAAYGQSSKSKLQVYNIEVTPVDASKKVTITANGKPFT